MFDPKLVKNFLTKEECSYLVNFVKDIEEQNDTEPR